MIEVLRLTFILAWFIIAVDDMSFVRAVLVSGSTVWRRFSETAVVVLALGLVQCLWLGPAWRLISYGSELAFGKDGPAIVPTAIEIVTSSALAMIGIWFC
ncbi:MAG: hypothetical protein JXA57_15455, partial [Armatimonadetes bacterium]|nr:hypothetical protein [Armatimonadota bacterium]